MWRCGDHLPSSAWQEHFGFALALCAMSITPRCDSHRLSMELDSAAPVLDLSENYEDFNPGLGLYNLIENF